MKIRLNDKPRGLVLLVALIVIAVAGIVMASYLKMMQSEAKSVTRSQVWNKCVPVMEAGVEEAMAQIQACGNTTNFSSNGWTYYTNGYYQKTRSIGTNGSYYLVSIQPVIPPVIYSTAYVPIPDTSTNYISRQVMVKTQSGKGSYGLVARGTISLQGGSAFFDSYDSSVGYIPPPNNGTNGLALSDTNVSGAINMSGGAKIYGTAAVGPGGSVSASGGSSALSTNLDANYQIDDNSLPPDITNYSTGTLSGGKIGGVGTNYLYLVTDGKYDVRASMPNLTISSSGNPMAIVGNVTLVVSNLTISGSGYIYMSPGATLTLYVAGNFTASGSGIVNMSTLPANLSIIGLPTCKTVTYSGSAAFQGSVNAPEADFTFSGGAGAYGAFIGNTITISGSGGVHYDQSLGRIQFFLASSWNEL